MESYSPLLEKTRVPQPGLQKQAVVSIFSKLRSAPNHLDPESEPGKRAISDCLTSSSPYVVDESVRQLCSLVTDTVISISRGLMELQSSLEGSDPKLVPVFVKALGFLVRFGFQKNNASWTFPSIQTHPFVMVLSCRSEVQSELLQQVLRFMLQNKQLGMAQVCEFLRPLLNFSFIRLLTSDSSSSSFGLQLVSSMASFCCSFPNESMPVFKLLMSCLKYLPYETSEDYRKLVFVVEHMVDAYIVVLKSLAGEKSLIIEAQLCADEFLGTTLSLVTCLQWHPSGHEPIFELSRRLLSVQKDLGLRWEPGLSSNMVSLFTILVQSELEYEQISMLKLLLLILKWKYDKDDAISRKISSPFEDIMFLLPLVSLMSSPSKSVKALATDLLYLLEKLLIKMLVAPKYKPTIKEEIHYLSTPGIIVLRLLRHLWYQDGEPSSRISLLSLALKDMTDSEMMNDKPISWVSHVRGFCLSIIDRQKSSLHLSLSQEVFITEMPLLLSSVLSVLLIHPSMGGDAVDSLSSIGIMDPKVGVPLLLIIMFYSNIFTRNNAICHDMLFKILEMLPSLASHSAMIPLVVQTILPMLNRDAKVSLYATATRLLCRTWEINDRAFGSLQGVLLPKGFTDFMSDRAIRISLAASIRDVCHKSPDRGVDMILSVSACIESQDPVIKALGLQSLAHLCEADVIDFYTAWDVIATHVQGYLDDPILAHSICLLLRWGAMDAEAYSEASESVMQIIWDVVTSGQETKWEKARISALEALTQYDVSQLEKSIPDFKKMYLELFFSEISPKVLKVMEDFHVRIITYEHRNRRRLVKEKRVKGNKIEKLLDVFPQVIFSSGKIKEAGELPGAALLCFAFTPKNVDEYQGSKRLRYVHTEYENALVEIAASLQLSRNILLALMALQSWKDFVRRWMKAYIVFYDAKTQLSVLDKTSKAASDILKSMIAVADGAIPRAAENIALAIGALCAVLPPSVHTVKSAASKFLLEWLFQHEHEYRQWSAAISLGLISSCLHVTDHKERYDNITGLLEVLFVSKSSLVKGACGVGLGFSCQDLLIRVETSDDTTVKKDTKNVSESELMGRIVRALAIMIKERTKCSSDVLDSLCSCFPFSSDVNAEAFEWSSEDGEDLEDDIWGVAGLVLGLATSICAIYRAGELETVIKIKKLLISWLPYADSSFQSPKIQEKMSHFVLALGSCIALPTIVTFCQRMELMDDIELNHIVSGFKEFLSELISVKKSGVLHHSLLMASCAGAGTVISCILNEGVHSIEVERVKCLLELFQKCYSNPFSFLVHLGGMLGVVNAMGAGTGILVYMHFPTYTSHSGYQKEDSSSVMGSVLSSSVFEPYLTSLVQEMFLVAQNSDNHQLQQFASWVLALLRHHLWSKELLGVDADRNVSETNLKSVSQSFPEDSVVLKLCLWLMDFKYSEPGSIVHAVRVVATLRCLSRAPRLPDMDWGAIIRRCMRYEAKVTEFLEDDSAFKKGTLREECVLFAIAHANQFNSLLTFLDELSDFSRFKTLEINLQSCLLIHLADLAKVYSGSRLEKLFGDVGNHFSLFNSYDEYGTYQKSLLRISCWKGLHEFLYEVSVDTSGHISHVERCMEILFLSLPVVQLSCSVMSGELSFAEEWSEAVRCLGKAPQSWLLDFLKVSHDEFVQSAYKSIEVRKKVHAKIKLVNTGSLPLIELGKMKSFILNSKSEGLWSVLSEVVAALHHAEINIKRQWLIDALEISCVSSFPSTALQFIGLLSATCCKYMSVMIVDQQVVLNDLPVTLVSLLADRSWKNVAGVVVSHLFSSTERIYDWATHIADDASYIPGSQPIDESENHMADFLLQVMHHTCVLLKGYLPLDKQLKLASMVVTTPSLHISNSQTF